MRGKAHEAEKNRVKPNSEPISKIEAAFRQLRTAVLLFFSDQDPVAVHTLAAAAHEILRQLAERKGIPVGLAPAEMVAVLPGMTPEEAKAALSVTAGFFKHAGRDPNDSIHFQPEINDHFLYEAVCLYEELTSRHHPEFEHLKMIVTMRNPHLLPVSIAADERAKWEERAGKLKKDKITPSILLKRVLGLEMPDRVTPDAG